MTYKTYNDITLSTDYLIIGYKNRFNQLDVAKFKFELLQSYYIPSSGIVELETKLDELESFINSALVKLSSDKEGCLNKITRPELSAYCTHSRYEEMKGERTFITTDSIMDHLKKKFETKTKVNDTLKLSKEGKPLSVAVGKINKIFEEAYKTKDE